MDCSEVKDCRGSVAEHPFDHSRIEIACVVGVFAACFIGESNFIQPIQLQSTGPR